jgi:hypothetical protein
LQKLDLSDAALFPFRRVSVLVVAVKLASPGRNSSAMKRRAAHTGGSSLHVKQNVLIFFTVLELNLRQEIKHCFQNSAMCTKTHFVKGNKSFELVLGLGALASSLDLPES